MKMGQLGKSGLSGLCLLVIEELRLTGGAEGGRTPDLRIANAALCQTELLPHAECHIRNAVEQCQEAPSDAAAWSIATRSFSTVFPPPWAMSGLPPPRPSTIAHASRTRALMSPGA